MRVFLIWLITLLGTVLLGWAWSAVCDATPLGKWWGGWGTAMIQVGVLMLLYRRFF